MKSLDFGEILECVLDLSQVVNTQLRTVINKRAGDMIGQIPETLAKILAPEMAKETILSLEAELGSINKKQKITDLVAASYKFL